MAEPFVLDNLMRYIGQTVTIFTTSGGLSGSGFTGVLAGICDNTVKLITDIGAAPTCPIGNTCNFGGGCSNGFGFGNNFGFGNSWNNNFGNNFGFGNSCCNNCGNNFGFNWLGSVTEIPICKIASFTHNAI